MRPESTSGNGNQPATSTEASDLIDGSGSLEIRMSDGEISDQVESTKQLFVEGTENYSIPQLERLYTRIMKGIFETRDIGDDPKPSILKFLLKMPYLIDEIQATQLSMDQITSEIDIGFSVSSLRARMKIN